MRAPLRYCMWVPCRLCDSSNMPCFLLSIYPAAMGSTSVPCAAERWRTRAEHVALVNFLQCKEIIVSAAKYVIHHAFGFRALTYDPSNSIGAYRQGQGWTSELCRFASVRRAGTRAATAARAAAAPATAARARAPPPALARPPAAAHAHGAHNPLIRPLDFEASAH